MWPVAIAPLLVVAGIALIQISNELLYIGPLDRAAFGWSVPIPMILLAPATAGVVARWTGEGIARAALVATAIGLGVFLVATMTASIDRIGCDIVTSKVQVLLQVAPIGLLTSGAFVVAGEFAVRTNNRPVIALIGSPALAVIGGAATLLLFAAQFPGVTCVPRPTG